MATHPDRTTASDRPRASGGESPGLRTVSLEQVRRTLDNDRRREVLSCLLATDDPVPVQTLVARLADAEYDATAVTTLHAVRQRVHVSLCRTHLPALEEHGLVAYDRPRGTVSRGANLTEFESILADALEQPIPARSRDEP